MRSLLLMGWVLIACEGPRVRPDAGPPLGDAPAEDPITWCDAAATLGCVPGSCRVGECAPLPGWHVECGPSDDERCADVVISPSCEVGGFYARDRPAVCRAFVSEPPLIGYSCFGSPRCVHD